MKQIKILVLGIAATAGVLIPLTDANAWVAAGRGYGGRGFVAAGGYHGPTRSPDRADALVWALSELMLGQRPEPRVMRI